MNGEYYPFRTITLPELASGSLTHQLTPALEAVQSTEGVLVGPRATR